MGRAQEDHKKWFSHTEAVAHSDYFLLKNLQKTLRGKMFSDELKSEIYDFLDKKPAA